MYVIYDLKTCCGLDISHYEPNNLENWCTSPTCWGAYDRSVRTWSYVHLGPGAQFLTCKFLGQMTWWFHQPGKQGEKQTIVTKWLHHQQHKWKKSIWNPFLEWCDPTTSILQYSEDVTGWKIHHRCWSPRQLPQGAGACGQLGHPDTSCLVKVRVGTESKKIKHVSSLKYGSSTFNIVFFEKLLMFNIAFPSNRGEPTSYSKHSERSIFFKLHWGSFPSDEDGYPFQPAATSAIGICSVNLFRKLDFQLHGSWSFHCIEHPKKSWMECQTGFDKGPFEIWKFIPIDMCWTLAGTGPFNSRWLRTNPRSCFIFTFIFMDDNPSTFMSFFFGGGRGWKIVTPTGYLYLWVNKWSRFHEKSTTWKTSRLEDLPHEIDWCSDSFDDLNMYVKNSALMDRFNWVYNQWCVVCIQYAWMILKGLSSTRYSHNESN